MGVNRKSLKPTAVGASGVDTTALHEFLVAHLVSKGTVNYIRALRHLSVRANLKKST